MQTAPTTQPAVTRARRQIADEVGFYTVIAVTALTAIVVVGFVLVPFLAQLLAQMQVTITLPLP